MAETIKTITTAGNSLFKDKGSKHFGYVYYVASEEEAKHKLEEIKNIHPKANHHCFSFIIKNGNQPIERYNDDGEPNNSAGLPIFNQLKKYELENVLAVVVRYFGGTKLGVGGLINAYKTATELAIQNAEIITTIPKINLKLSADFSDISGLNQILKQNQIEIKNEIYTNRYSVIIEIYEGDEEITKTLLHHLKGVKIEKV